MNKAKAINEKTVVRAVDVGFGNTKYTTGPILDYQDVSVATVPTGSFPSVVVKSRGNQKFNVGIDEVSDVTQITIDGSDYIVGPDVLTHTQGLQARNLSEEYCTTNDYLALLRGALFRIAAPVIDILVLGLPLNTFQQYKDELQIKMTGPHQLPHPNPVAASQGKTFSTEVKRVEVVPQPIGAFFSYAVPMGLYANMTSETNLILDPGFGTFDWFLASGLKGQHNRCSAFKGGVSGILMAVADAIGPSVRQSPTLMARVDKAIVRTFETKEPVMVKVAGVEHDLQKYKGLAMEQAREQINAMVSGVNTLIDVDNVILTGGGHAHFLPALKEALDREILVVKDPLLANCLGFQLLGQTIADNQGA